MAGYMSSFGVSRIGFIGTVRPLVNLRLFWADVDRWGFAGRTAVTGPGGHMARNKEVLTTGEVARICKVAPRTVTKWFDSGQLRGYRIPGSQDRRIPVNQLVRFMRQNNMPLDGMLHFTKTRILIVDDEGEIVEMLRDLLSTQTTYEVQTAKNGFAAGIGP